MTPREVYGCAKPWQRAGTEVRNFGVWSLGPQPAERGVFGPKKGIALDQTGYGAFQRIHLGPLNRTFPALNFPGSALSVENHSFGPLGQSASFRRRYPAKKSVKPELATGMARADAQAALGTAGAMGPAEVMTGSIAPHSTCALGQLSSCARATWADSNRQ